MRCCTRLTFLAFLIILTNLLCGCAVYSVYRKCGYDGCAGDAQITAEVHALLNQHPELGPPNQVYVQTLDRVVYLSGQVATELQRDTADSVALQARGARSVNDIMGVEYNGR
jgi:osmotically-inducible protein OsmY